MIKWEIFAMRRSGHHAVMEWIFKRCTAQVVHVNNADRAQQFSYYGSNDLIVATSFEDKLVKFNKSVDLTILVVRDFENWLASRIHSGRTYPGLFPRKQEIERYLQHASLFNSLKDSTNVLPISFDDWYCDIRYRINVHTKLGLKGNLTIPEQRAHVGTYFDDHDVLSRKNKLKDDPDYQNFLAIYEEHR